VNSLITVCTLIVTTQILGMNGALVFAINITEGLFTRFP
jgi:hypothetical protein